MSAPPAPRPLPSCAQSQSGRGLRSPKVAAPGETRAPPRVEIRLSHPTRALPSLLGLSCYHPLQSRFPRAPRFPGAGKRRWGLTEGWGLFLPVGVGQGGGALLRPGSASDSRLDTRRAGNRGDRCPLTPRGRDSEQGP